MAAFKCVVVLSVVVAAVSAQHGGFGGGFGGFGGGFGVSGGGQGGDEGHGHEDYHHHPSYKFEYAVNDPHTHDIKKHSEHRDGDKTEGEYSLVEPDGTIRTVKYHVHGKSGFVATVHRSGHAVHPQTTYHGGHQGGQQAGGFGGHQGGFGGF